MDHYPPSSSSPSSSSLIPSFPSPISTSLHFFASSDPSSSPIPSSLSRHPPPPPSSSSSPPLQLPPFDPDQAFDSFLPAPFRSLFFISFNLFTWASILLILHLRQSHSISLLVSSSSSSSSSAPTSNRSIYQASYYAALSLLILASLSLLIHRSLSYHLHLIPPSSPLLILPPLFPFILFLLPSRLTPFSAQFRLPQRRLLRTLHRLFFPPSLLPHSPTPFHHILLADLLTSLSRPLGDLASFLASILLLPPSFQAFLSIAFSSLPYLLRFKQCLNDLILGPRRLKSSMNAIKYSTAIPVIILNSRLMRSRSEKERGNHLITWILAYSINSIYSSWWDIVNDWGISRREIIRWYRFSYPDHRKRVDESSNGLPLTTSSNSPPTGHHHHHPISLPGHRILFDQRTWWGYLILIAINLTLRMTWTIGIFVRPPKMMGIRLSFLMELIEIIRRSIWCLVRLEWEEINRKRSNDYYLELTDDDDQLLGSAEEEEEDDDDEDEEEYDDHRDSRINRDPIIVNHPHLPLDATKKILEDEPYSNHPHPDSTRDLKTQSLTPTSVATSPAAPTTATTTTTMTSSHHHPFILHPSPSKVDHHHHALLKIKKNHA